MQVASLLGNALGMIMPSTVVFDYPTIDALSSFVAASMVQPLLSHFPWHLLPSLQAPVRAKSQQADNRRGLPRDHGQRAFTVTACDLDAQW